MAILDENIRNTHAESRWHRQAPEGRVEGLHEGRGHRQVPGVETGCTRAGDADRRRRVRTRPCDEDADVGALPASAQISVESSNINERPQI